MLPGFVSGFYTRDECHVDLNRLARYAGATLILQPAIGLDLQVLQSCLAAVRMYTLKHVDATPCDRCQKKCDYGSERNCA